jgi:hypothetical protein
LGPTEDERLGFFNLCPKIVAYNSKRIEELFNLFYLFFFVSEEDPDEYVWLDDPEANFHINSRIE